jgi:hypothetical protein
MGACLCLPVCAGAAPVQPPCVYPPAQPLDSNLRPDTVCGAAQLSAPLPGRLDPPQEDLASRGRKMVTIVDPHVKRDASYYIFDQVATTCAPAPDPVPLDLVWDSVRGKATKMSESS